MTVTSRTTNYGFGLIDFNSKPWHEEEHANWTLLDSLLNTVNSGVPFVIASGSANAYVTDYDPAVSAYVEGLELSFQPNHTNSGASTLNVNGLGAKAIKVSGVDVPADILQDDGYVRVVYNGTYFILVQASVPSSVGQTVPDPTGQMGKLLGNNGVAPAWTTLSALTEYTDDQADAQGEAIAFAVSF
jgi:hypothetical protein